MATASEDPKFREELGTIEQCECLFSLSAWLLTHPLLPGFRLLSESEQTASLYTLLQHAKPVQIKFLAAVLTQMSDNLNPPTRMFSMVSDIHCFKTDTLTFCRSR